MQLKFTTDNNLRKIFIAYNTYRTLPKEMLHFPQILGSTFYNGYLLYSYFYNLPNQQYRMKIFRDVFYGKSNTVSFIKELLDNFDIPLINEDDQKFERYRNLLMQFIVSNSAKVSKTIKKIFGFEPPDTVTVLLCELYSGLRPQGLTLVYDSPSLIGFGIDKLSRANEIHDILLHEIIHVVIRKNKKINYSKKESALFEEDLVRYFAPRGIISKELGIKPDASLTKVNGEIQSSHRNQLFNSTNLMEVVENYSKDMDNKTIWDILKNTEYKRFLL